MFQLPAWLLLLVGSLVLIFGAFRIYLGAKKPDPQAAPRKGLYGLGRRTHFLVGVLYILMGGVLILSAFGVRPPWARDPSSAIPHSRSLV
jgi:hypothetical protein